MQEWEIPLRRPLTPDETTFLPKLAAAKPPDLSSHDFFTRAAGLISERFRTGSRSTVDTLFCAMYQSVALQPPQSLPDINEARLFGVTRAELHAGGCSFAAAPRPTHCFQCSQPLQLRVAKPSPVFHPASGQPGPGRLNHCGQSPLDLAQAHGHVEVVREL